MSKGVQLLLLGLITVLFFLFCEWFYLCKCVQVCIDRDAIAVADYDATIITDPIVFDWSKEEAITTDYFSDYKQRILASNQNDSILQIVGFYSDGETNPTDSVNLGFPRAAQIQALFPEIPPERIKLRARKVSFPSTAQERSFVASELRWLPPKVIATAEEPAPEETARVEELADRALIYFPYNSTQRIANPAIDVYLDRVVEQLTANANQRIRLTGHTDNTGNPDFNKDLGLRRANAIRTLLVAKGINGTRIEVASRGQNEPISSNASDAGKAENRRVELKVL